MGRESLTLEEKLSPIRLTHWEPSHGLNEKENFNQKSAVESSTFVNHARIYPHGLQAKHGMRRNTINFLQSAMNTPEKHNKRAALTSPRLAIPALFPPNLVDTVTGSPSYRIRSKRVNSGTRCETDTYFQGIGKGPSRISELEVEIINDSPPAKKRIIADAPQTSASFISNAVEEGKIGCNLHSEIESGSCGKNFTELHSEQSSLSSHVRRKNSTILPLDGLSNTTDTSRELIRLHDEDLTLNLLRSPDSRPLYSSRYLDSMRERYQKEIKTLDKAIADKNIEMSNLLSKINTIEQALMVSVHDLEQLKRKICELEISNESYSFKLAQSANEFSNAAKKLNRKDSMLYLLNEKLDLVTKRSVKDKSESSKEIDKLQNLLEISNNELLETQRVLSDARFQAEDLRKLLEIAKAENDDSEEKLAALFLDRDSLQLKVHSLNSRNIELESHIKEIEDSLSVSVAAKEDLNTKLLELMKEMEKLQEDMAMFENQTKRMEAELASKTSQIKMYEVELESARDKIRCMEVSLESTQRLAADNENLETEKASLLYRVSTLESQNQEKDRIISGDTKKLSQLVEELDHQKQLLSDFKTSTTRAAIGQDDELLHQIASLKRQVANAQLKTDERIQEVAEQLFHQYSKKHELKVNQLKEKYEAKLEDKNKQIDLKIRQIESMESRIKMGEKEKNYLLHLLEKSETTN